MCPPDRTGVSAGRCPGAGFGCAALSAKYAVMDLCAKYAPVAAKAYDLVHGLRLVGLNDTEIGNLVSRAKWDKERQTFPRIEERLDLEMEAMGCHSFGDRRAAMQALHTRFELEIARQRRLACQIAREELEQTAHGSS